MKKTPFLNKLGLKQLPKNAPLKLQLKRKAELEKLVLSRKYKGYTLRRIRQYMTIANDRINELKGIKKMPKNFNPNQLNLPGFLKSLDIVRIEELIANKIVEKVQNKTRKSAKKSTRKAA